MKLYNTWSRRAWEVGAIAALLVVVIPSSLYGASIYIGERQMADAIDGFDVQRAHALVDSGMRTSVRGRSGMTLLMIAAAQDEVGFGEKLIGMGVELEARDENGRSAVMWASMCGSTRTLKMLLRRGAKPRVVDSRGWTARRWAVYLLPREKRTTVLQLLGGSE